MSMDIGEMIALFTIGLVFGVFCAETIIWYGSRPKRNYRKDLQEYE